MTTLSFLKKNAKILLFLWIAGLFINTPLCRATEVSGPNLRVVSDDKMSQIEDLHIRAEENILKNNFREAIRLYSEIILLEPDDETAYTGMGQSYLILGDYRRATEAYLNALNINPDNETAYRGLQKISDPDRERSFGVSETNTEKLSETLPEIEKHVPATEEPLLVQPIQGTISSSRSEVLNFKEAAPKPEAEPQPEPVPAETEQPVEIPAYHPAEPVNTDPPPAPKTIHYPKPARLSPQIKMLPYSWEVSPKMKKLTYPQAIQTALKNGGFYDGPIDGKIGPRSRAAIIAFQKYYDITPDGKVASRTWIALQPFLNKNSYSSDY